MGGRAARRIVRANFNERQCPIGAHCWARTILESAVPDRIARKPPLRNAAVLCSTELLSNVLPAGACL